MQTFHIPSMSCGHCVATIRQALTEADPDAKVDIALERKEVAVTSTRLGDAELRNRLSEAGYPPV
ncbi:MAG: heavy-metal-associated domain-containing protein [Rhodocyclaceae bacterium]